MTAVVYWLLDADDNILYIGCTSQSLKYRMAHHVQVKEWWPSVASVAHTDYMPREVAFQVESQDIAEMQPWYNVADKYGLSGAQIAQACSQYARRFKATVT